MKKVKNKNKKYAQKMKRKKIRHKSSDESIVSMDFIQSQNISKKYWDKYEKN
jgi:hypothetical protein